ncbi:hypothetical protein Pelo_13096 [Pelomyxa schiedti]|nr:hypothetical protein Pelo_13096 [Pelomyxa schiedti]
MDLLDPFVKLTWWSSTMVVATYGTLKRGFRNHGMLEGAEYLGDSVARGAMFLRPSGPCALLIAPTPTGTDHAPTDGEPEPGCRPTKEWEDARDHVVEVYRCTRAVFERVEAVEVRDGYVTGWLGTQWGPAAVFYMPRRGVCGTDVWIPAFTLDVLAKHNAL